MDSDPFGEIVFWVCVLSVTLAVIHIGNFIHSVTL